MGFVQGAKKLFSKIFPMRGGGPTKAYYFHNFPSLTGQPPTFTYDHLLKQYKNPDEVQDQIARQARAIVGSVGIVSSAIQTLITEILGEKGILLDINTQDFELNNRIEQEFLAWSRNVGSNVSLFRLQRELVRKYYVDGEAFLTFYEKDGKLQIRLLDTFKLSRLTNERERIYHGVEFDAQYWEPVFYYFESKDRDTLPLTKEKLIKIEASEIIHFKNGDGIRGISPLAPIIDESTEANELCKATLRRGILTSQMLGFMKVANGIGFNCDDIPQLKKNANGELVKDDAADSAPKNQYDLTPNVLERLPPGFEPHFVSPAEPPELKEFLDYYLYSLGGVLGLTYPTLTGDLSEVNYSSIRAGSLKERRFFGAMQNMLIQEVLSPIFERWLTHPSNYGSKNYEAGVNTILASHSFKTPVWKHVDPAKEATATATQIKDGILTLTEVLKSRGKDINEHKQEMEQDQELMEILGQNLMLRGDIENPNEADEQEVSGKSTSKSSKSQSDVD